MNQLPANNINARISAPLQAEKHEQSHARGVNTKPVSYTHLTLPTID
jgi:hypothetical protein